MAFALSGTLTGATVPGWAGPTTFGILPDTFTGGKQYVVNSAGGTGPTAAVTPHSLGSPFTITAFKVPVYRALGTPNPVTGVIANVPLNTSRLKIRKGLTVLANQPTVVGEIDIRMSIPANSEVADQENLRALFAVAFAAAAANVSGLYDTTRTGTL